jgi:hypothetical protein
MAPGHDLDHINLSAISIIFLTLLSLASNVDSAYKIDLVVNYNSWTNLGAQGITASAANSNDTMPADLTAHRSEVAKMIESDLRVFLIAS